MRAPRLVLLALIVAAAIACARKHRSLDAGSVHVEVNSIGDTEISGAGLVAYRAVRGDDDFGDGLFGMRFRDRRPVAPLFGTVTIDGVRVRSDHASSMRIDNGAAVTAQPLAHERGELVTSIDPTTPAILQRVHVTSAALGTSLRYRLDTTRLGDVILAEGLPIAHDGTLSESRTPYLVLTGETALVLASPSGLSVSGAPDRISIEVLATASELGALDATIALSMASTTAEAMALGAKLAHAPARRGAIVSLAPSAFARPIAARVLVEAFPDAPSPPLIFDPSRGAEPSAPMIDVVTPRFDLLVPAGRYVLRATHGIGWSIARAELTVHDGDVVEVPLELVHEVEAPGTVGCDLHVHAQGSFDATATTYEDRVRSLVAVGVDCAAATEHDHVGDHAPAAHALGVDQIFRALTGVELTTGAPAFGHFNVYPWPSGAMIPKTHETTVDAMFDAVHALPGEHVFQLNHPRMETGNHDRIGYLDLAGVDPVTGLAHGKIVYRRDYDALEVFNGYQLGDPDSVLRIVDEWLRMLDRGDVHVATGSSDSHGISFPWAGFPRTLVDVGERWVEAGRPIDALVDALKKGRATISSGPFVAMHVGAATIGDEVKGSRLDVSVEVRLTSWLGAPTLSLRLGADRLDPIELKSTGKQGVFVATAKLPKIDRRRALVAIVQADTIGVGQGAITGMSRALSITNPIWIVP